MLHAIQKIDANRAETMGVWMALKNPHNDIVDVIIYTVMRKIAVNYGLLITWKLSIIWEKVEEIWKIGATTKLV